MIKHLNSKLLRISRLSAWVLLPLIIIYIITGFSMTGRYGFNKLISIRPATLLHDKLCIPLIIFFVLHTGISIYFAFKRKKIF